MRIKLVDVINKYPTTIDTDQLIDKFKDMILFSDVKGDTFLGLTTEKITIKDIPKPKVTELEYNGKLHEMYIYTFRGYILEIMWVPSEKKIHYLKFDIPLGSLNTPSFFYLFDEDGSTIFS